MYELTDKPIKSFAVANDFVEITNKACYRLGQNLMPFCIYADDLQREEGTVDLIELKSLEGRDGTIEDDIVSTRLGVYGAEAAKASKKFLVYDYFLSISICYVEVPKWVTKNGVPQKSYDKFFCTRNPAVMAAWMGAEPNEMQAKYTSRIRLNQYDFDNSEIRFVRMNSSAKGNSISVPRSVFKTADMRCIPLYMLYGWIEGMKGHLETEIVKFTYTKDNGSLRELCSTISNSILMKYYNDSVFVGSMLSAVDINTVQQGGMQLPSMLYRGFIRIPEVGASVYDGTGVRALNVARIVSAEVVNSVDTSYIKVDLNSVVDNFCEAVEYIASKLGSDTLRQCYAELTGKPAVGEDAVLVSELQEYAKSNAALLTTTFKRDLHTFMVSRPNMFPLYTGRPNTNVVSSNNVGVVPLDF